MFVSLHEKPLYRLFVWVALIVGLAALVWLVVGRLSDLSFLLTIS